MFTNTMLTTNPPRGAHPVEAPFKRSTVNEPITGTYIVEIATISNAPDTVLSSNNGRIDVEVYFQGGLPRPIAVDVGSVNGQIKLAVPELQHAQYLNMHVHSVNGATVVALPSTYRGFLRLHSVNGHMELGDSLEKHSRHIGGNVGKEMLYFVDGNKSRDDKIFSQFSGNEEEHLDPEKMADLQLEENSLNFSQREDNCFVKTVSGSIRVGFYDDDWFEENAEDINGMAWNSHYSQKHRECCMIS